MVLTYVLIGIAAGVLSGMFGIGGGILIVPALVFFAGMPMKTATGTSLGVFLLPVGFLAALSYYRAGQMQWKVSLMVGVGLVLGAWLGAKLNQQVTAATAQRLFAAFLVLVAARMWLKA
jgi:uncharacterized protein